MELKRVYNKYFPFSGNKAMTVIPWIFIREKAKDRYTVKDDRHEHTHGYQQLEMLIAGAVLTLAFLILGFGWWSLLALPIFFELYLLEWVIKAPFCRWDFSKSYRSISAEQEAYEHEDEIGYNNVRKHFNWLKYVFTIKK